jgi:uncharacterized protein DUF6093
VRLNLLPIRKLVEGLTMNDTCLISSDPELTSDDTWDEETGTYTPPDPDRVTIYEGQCTVYPMSANTRDEEQGGEQMSATRYWLGIPMSAEVTVKPEYLVVITAVDPRQGDPELVDQMFIVEDQEFNTMAATRRFMMKKLLEVP